MSEFCEDGERYRKKRKVVECTSASRKHTKDKSGDSNLVSRLIARLFRT